MGNREKAREVKGDLQRVVKELECQCKLFLILKLMIISDEKMEKIIKNLFKVESSFHYQDNKIHEELVASTKKKKMIGYILLILA